jgi:hypothetical protein
MEVARLCVIAVLVGGLWAHGTIGAGGAGDAKGPTRASVVPTAAVLYAEGVLESRWPAFVASSTYAEYAKGSDASIAGSSLGDPFRSLVIRGRMLDAFVRSPDTDPLAYASKTKFVFPVLASTGDDAGAIIVILNQDDNGEPLVESDKEYTLGGFILPGSSETEATKAMRRSAPDAVVDRVHFVDIGLPPQFVVRYRDGHIMSGEDASRLRPIAETSEGIKNCARARQPQEGR